jgi:hypothetical protein
MTRTDETSLRILFDTKYVPEEKKWLVNVSNKTPALTFGLWQVSDSTGEVTPVDEVARSIATPDIICNMPVTFLAAGKTPPLFLTPAPAVTPTPVPTPTPAPTPIPTPRLAVASAEEARLRVWISVYNRYHHWPESSAFTAYFDEGLQRWIVEGRSAIANYGLWLVDATTGEITPWDKLAKQAAESDTPMPTVLTAEQATIRVWVSIYDCFDARPSYSDFTAYQESPQRWVVEGIKVDKSQTVVDGVLLTEEERTDIYYGLWLVDTDTARVVPWNTVARQIAARICFKTP